MKMYSSHGYDSEDEFIPKNVCLDIGEIPGDVDLTKTPSNGQEYLQQVVWEASQCRDVVVAKLDRSKLKKQVKNPNYGYWNFIPEAPPVSDDLKPTKAWQSFQIANFLALKLKIECMKERISEGKIDLKDTIQLPAADSEPKWKKLVIQSQFVPSLKVMLSFEQNQCESVVVYLKDWMEEKLTDIWEVGALLYSIFVCMEMPLDSGVVFCLRSLARHCAFTRCQEKNLNDQKVAALNLFICIVSNCFQQKDLMDVRSDGL